MKATVLERDVLKWNETLANEIEEQLEKAYERRIKEEGCDVEMGIYAECIEVTAHGYRHRVFLQDLVREYIRNRAIDEEHLIAESAKVFKKLAQKFERASKRMKANNMLSVSGERGSPK